MHSFLLQNLYGGRNQSKARTTSGGNDGIKGKSLKRQDFMPALPTDSAGVQTGQPVSRCALIDPRQGQFVVGGW
jgi:hypothetical protein